jgi:hypothetical protein
MGGGAGSLLITVPVNLASGYTMLHARIYDASGAIGYPAVARYYSATQVYFTVSNSSATYATDTSVVGSGAPVTFAAGDIVHFGGVYESTV